MNEEQLMGKQPLVDKILRLEKKSYGKFKLINFELALSLFGLDKKDGFELFRVTNIFINEVEFIYHYENYLIEKGKKIKNQKGNYWTEEDLIKDLDTGMAWEFINDTIFDNAIECFKRGITRSGANSILNIVEEDNEVWVSVNGYENDNSEILHFIEKLFEESANFFVEEILNVWLSYFKHFNNKKYYNKNGDKIKYEDDW